jgi:hypothetical protein
MPNTDADHTYNLEENTGKVRLLVSDIGGKGESVDEWVFSDPEIEAFLNLWEQNLFMSAATALRVMAGNEAMVAKKITFLELETDGPATAGAMEKTADKFEIMSDNEVDFELIQMGVDLFSRREIRREQFGEVW